MATLAQWIVALSQGIVFFHAGDELLRSKSLDRDSYDSGTSHHVPMSWRQSKAPAQFGGTNTASAASAWTVPAVKITQNHRIADMYHKRRRLRLSNMLMQATGSTGWNGRVRATTLAWGCRWRRRMRSSGPRSGPSSPARFASIEWRFISWQLVSSGRPCKCNRSEGGVHLYLSEPRFLMVGNHKHTS